MASETLGICVCVRPPSAPWSSGKGSLCLPVSHCPNMCVSLPLIPEGLGSPRLSPRPVFSPSSVGSNLGVLAQGGCSAPYADEVGATSV